MLNTDECSIRMLLQHFSNAAVTRFECNCNPFVTLSTFHFLNSKKCHLLINKGCRAKINIGNNRLGNSKCEKLLRIKFDRKLNFEAHVGDLYKQAGRKMHALAILLTWVFLKKELFLTFSCIMLKNGQTYFKNLVMFTPQDF